MKQYAVLVHDHWRSTYKLLLVVIVIAVASCLGTFVHLLRADTVTRDDYATFSGVAIGGLHIAHLLWLMFLLFSSGDEDDLSLSMPRYLMRLPTSAFGLVAARMSYGVASTAALALLGTLTYYGLFDERMEQQLAFTSLVTIYPTLYAVLQAAVWCVGPAGIVPTMAVVLFGSLLSNWIIFDFQFWPFDPDQYSVAGIGAAVTLSFLAAGIVLAQHRKGRFSFLEGLSTSLSGPRTRAPIEWDSFASKEEALRWYEYRRQWRVFPAACMVTFVALLALFLLMPPRLAAGDIRQTPIDYVAAYYADRVINAFSSTLIVAVALVGGFFIFRGWRPLFTKERSFLFIRPVTVRTLTTARLESGVRSVGFGVLPLFIVLLIALFLNLSPGPRNPRTGQPEWDSIFMHLADGYPVYLVVLMTVLAFASLFAAVWAGLWLENVFIIGGVFALVAFVMENLPNLQEMEPAVRANYEFRIAAAILLAAGLSLVVLNLRKRLLHPRYVAIAAGIAPMVGVGFFLYLNTNAIVEQTPLDVSLMTTIVPLYMMAVVAPLLTVPLFTQWARHRR